LCCGGRLPSCVMRFLDELLEELARDALRNSEPSVHADEYQGIGDTFVQ
jgi:hypothetical protein